MIKVRMKKFNRCDNHIIVVIRVNERDICNFPNADKGARTIYPFIEKRDID